MASGKNKQYGLILPTKSNTSQRPTASKKNVFGDESDSNSDEGGDWVKRSLKREAQQSVQKRATKIQMKQALEEDPTVFQYDEIYDDLEQKKVEAKVSKKGIEKKPRYIQALLQTAEKRKKENERRIERQVQKEREEEGNQFADKESFVTASYRQKLEEFKKQEEEEKRMERLEAIGDVTKQKDLTGFYRHLLRQTMGESLPAANEIKSEKIEGISGEDDGGKPSKPVSEDINVEKSPVRKGERIRDRQYRKRQSSTSSSQNSDLESSSVTKIKEENVDADLDLTGSSSSNSESESSVTGSGSEEGEIIKKRKDSDRSKDGDENQKKKSKRNDHNLKGENVENKGPMKDEPGTVSTTVKEERPNVLNDNTNIEKKTDMEEDKIEADSTHRKIKDEVKATPKINIWIKRTIGQAFDDAVQRYYERKAARVSLRIGRA